LDAASVRKPGIGVSRVGTGRSAVFCDLLTARMVGGTAGELTVTHLASIAETKKEEEREEME